MIALNRAFNFGPKMNKKFLDELNAVINELADTDDKEYAIAKFEEVLQQACGENYTPREERYS